MKKFTMLILLLALSVSFSYGQQPTIKTNGTNSQTVIPERRSATSLEESAPVQRNTTGSNSLSVSNSSFGTIMGSPAGTASRNMLPNTYGNRAPVTITHSNTQNIVANNSVTCNAGGIPDENSFFRDFDLATDFGITDDFEVSSAEFAVEAVSGPTNLTINIYSTTTTFPGGYPGSATLQGTANYTSTAADAGMVVSVPITGTIPAGSILIYELNINAGATASWFPGSNADGQTGVSWIMSAACAITDPTDLTAIGFPDQHMVMNIVGEEAAGGPFPSPYCGPLVYASAVEPITLVDVAGISNVTDPTVNGTPAHEDFTAISGDMEEGMSYPIALEGNTDGGFTNSFTVFIDWNQDGILDNASERYEIGTIFGSTGTDGQQATGNILVPAGVVAGPTRMRVIKKFLAGFAPDSCTPGSGFGQAEDYTINVTAAGGGGGGVCGTPLLEVNQDATNTCMANITQGGLAQSYIALEAESAGAGIMFTATSSGLDVDLSLWDGLPNAGGTMLASGTSQTDGTEWADVYWDPVVNVTVGNTYYIVIEGDPTLPCVAGDTSNPYPGGNVYANAGYTPFPDFDYTFRTYSCDGGGGGGCPIVSDCNLTDTTPDDATSADVWDRPFADGTCCSGLGPVSYDVYGPFTVDITGLYTVDSDQIGGWDGYMFIYETCFDPLDQTTNYVAGDDDGPAGIGTCQIADVTLTAGTEYYLITTGFSAGDFGDFVNTITGVGTASCGGPVVTYDDCAGAIALACGDSVVGETLTATDSGGNPAPDVFYKFTGSGTPQMVTISLCGGGTDYDSALRVFDDCDLLNELAFNDDSCGLQSEVTFVSDGTSTYYIMVEGFGSSSGNFSLDVSCQDPLPNDDCSGAIAVSCGDSVTGSTVGSTIDSGAPACGPAITSPGVWYSFNDNSGLPGDITISLCNGTDFDSKLSIYSGTCSALVCVDGNDDFCGLQSEVSFASDGNTQYYILIHSFAGATGNFTLDVTCTPTPPPNDMIVNSIDVDEIGFPYTDPAVAMPAATTEGGNPLNCDLTGANGVWYNFVSGGDGQANAMIVTPGGASSVTFYTAPDENATETDLVLVPQNTNQCVPGTSASIYTLAGQAYYVFVLNTGAITDIVIDGTNLSVSENTIAGFSFYPNPTNGILNLKSVDNIDHVSLYNLLGQLVVDNRVDATSSQIDISGLSTGTYLMKVTVNGQTGTYKVLKD